MTPHSLRRAVVVALTLLVAIAASTPLGAVDARSHLRKVEPRYVTPYRIGRAFTPNTDVVSVSGYAAWMIDEALGATTPLPPLGSAFLRAERRTGVNARYLIAHAMLESGWGTSDIARYKHNLFGYGAYDRDPWRYASRFRTYEQGIIAVAEKIRARYLTPGGRWWYGFTTLRGMNRYYASDVRWADKIAVLANTLDGLVVTLGERRLHFGRPTFADTPIVRRRVALDVPWRARAGAVLPAAVRFRVRWTPVALVESSSGGPRTAPRPRWTFVARTDLPGRAARLALQAPSQPGVWRLEVDARDSDGRALPKTDHPRIRAITVRVAAAREAGLSLGVARDGRLAATVRNLGRVPIAASPAGAATAVEAWALPLDPALDAYKLTVVPLRRTLKPNATEVVRFAAPSRPAVVVVRLSSPDGAVGRTRPVAALVTRGRGGRPILAGLPVASARDDRLLHRRASPGRIKLGSVGEAGVVAVDVAAGKPTADAGAAVTAAEGAPGAPWLMVRSLAADPRRSAAPSRALRALPEGSTSAARLEVSGLPAGVRLVLAGVVPPDGGPADVKTLRLAWITVTALVNEAAAAPH